MNKNIQQILNVILKTVPTNQYVFFGSLCDYYHIDTDINLDIDIFIDEILYNGYIQKTLLEKLDIFTDIKPVYHEVKCNLFNQALNMPDILYGNNCDILYRTSEDYRIDLTVIKNIVVYQKYYSVMMYDRVFDHSFWIESPKTRYNKLNKLLLLKEQVDNNPEHKKYHFFYGNNGKKTKTIIEKIQKYRDKYEW